MSKLVLVGGGSGFIGRYLTKALEKSGFSALTISRYGGQNKSTNVITWEDIKRNGIPDKTFGVVNLAGQSVLDPTKRWSNTLKNDIWNSRIDTTATLRDAIIASSLPPSVWVTVSGVGYYPTHSTKVYTESYVCDKPNDFWTELATAWEKASVLPDTLNTDIRHVTIRSGVVLGKDGGAILQMKPPFKLGLGGPIGSGLQWFPWIHIDDIVGIFMHAIQNQNVSGILNGVAPDPQINLDFSKCFGRALCRPAFIPLPGFVVKGVFGKVRAKILLEGQKVEPKRTLELGYQFKYPTLEMALKEIVLP